MTDEIEYVIDSSVLIDYQKADDSILLLFTTDIGHIHIAAPVLTNEIKSFGTRDCQRLNISVEPMTISQLMEAATPQGSLSRYDVCSLVLARENNWAVITNDKPLIGRLEIENINYIRGLKLMTLLVNNGSLDIDRAIQTAKAIQSCNPRFITNQLINEFKNSFQK